MLITGVKCASAGIVGRRATSLKTPSHIHYAADKKCDPLKKNAETRATRAMITCMAVEIVVRRVGSEDSLTAQENLLEKLNSINLRKKLNKYCMR